MHVYRFNFFINHTNIQRSERETHTHVRGCAGVLIKFGKSLQQHQHSERVVCGWNDDDDSRGRAPSTLLSALENVLMKNAMCLLFVVVFQLASLALHWCLCVNKSALFIHV
jgi:hypothetical protein